MTINSSFVRKNYLNDEIKETIDEIYNRDAAGCHKKTSRHSKNE